MFLNIIFILQTIKKKHKIVGETKLNAQSHVNLKKLIMHE